MTLNVDWKKVTEALLSGCYPSAVEHLREVAKSLEEYADIMERDGKSGKSWCD